MTRSNLSVFAAAAMVAALITATSRSEGFERRVHASDCYSDGYDAGNILAGQGLYNRASSGVSLHCPVPDDSNALKENVARLDIYGYDGSESASVAASVCSTNWSVPGGSCGRMVYSGARFVGNYTLSPSLFEWSSRESRFDFVYLHVHIPGAGTALSSMRGFWLRD